VAERPFGAAATSAFFCPAGAEPAAAEQLESMEESRALIADRIGRAVLDFEQQRTGHRPNSVTVVVSDDVLVITLHGALSPAEQALARTPSGAAQLQQLHDALFATASGRLRDEIQRITGVAVRDAAARIEQVGGSMIHVFPTGTVVEVFLLAGRVAPESWSGSGRSDP
jgi:uncharacterized protein YbcI